MGVRISVARKVLQKRYFDRLREKVSIKVGLLQGLGKHPYSDASIIEIGQWNEFGTNLIPERPFLRTTFSENRKAYQSIFRKVIEAAVKRSASAERGLKALAQKCVADVRRTIDNWTDPPNALSTQLAKGRKVEGKPVRNKERRQQGERYREGHLIDDPLVDTGTLKRAISFLIEGL